MKMKNKILGILIILIGLTPLFAKEDILIKSDVAADLVGLKTQIWRFYLQMKKDSDF